MNREAKTNAKINEVRAARDASSAKIHQIIEKMDRLVKSSIDADDLERSINAMDYRLLRQERDAEAENFNNLNRILSQLQSSKLAEVRIAASKETLRNHSKVDVDQLIAREDYLAAKNEVFREEDAKFQSVTTDAVSTRSSIPADLEFDTLVAHAAVKRSLKDLSEKDQIAENNN